MGLIGIVLVVLITILGLYHFGWLSPEAERRVEQGIEVIEETGILDKSIREIGAGTLDTVRGALAELDEFALKELLDKVKKEEIDLGDLNKEELQKIIEAELERQPAD